MTKLTCLCNIGNELERKLKSIDINCAEDLIQLGSKEAYFRLKNQYPAVCLVHLYTLQGAIDNLPYHQLSDAVKVDLKCFNDALV